MKRLVFGLVILISFSVIDGYCGGKKDDPRINELEEKIAKLEKSNLDLEDQKDVLEKSNKDLENQNKNLDNVNEELRRKLAEQRNGQLMPFTWEIAKEANESLLRELHYILSSPLTLIINNHERRLDTKEGTLVIKEVNDPKKIRILSGDIGKWQNSSPWNKESFIVNFKVKDIDGDIDIALKFVREKERNYYVLSDVADTSKKVSLLPDGIPPYLCINLEFDNDKENPMYRNLSSGAQGISDSTGKPNPPPRIDPPKPPPPPLPPPLPQGNRNLIGNGTLTASSIAGYIQSKNTANMSRAKIEEIVKVYIAEAGKEKINYDIAIALMCEGTDFLNRKDKLDAHNYGDLRDINGRKTRFKTMTLGVRAHIQQIKIYASKSGPTAYPQVDPPRLKINKAHRGKYQTLDSLFSVWVTAGNRKAYREYINNILSEMYAFQNKR
jgi:hypothetical protein